MTQNQLARRAFLATAGATLGAMRVSGAEFPKELGAPPRPYGDRSPFEQSVVRFLPKTSRSIQLQENTSPGSVWHHHTLGLALRGPPFGGP